ncbi:MAG TPA: MFS transporter [Bacillota bacterium]|nr:MFS transporter [Bacillota bacterium]
MEQSDQSVLRNNLRWNNIHGIMSVLSMNMVAPFTGLFAIRLGATDAQIAALSSWPALAGLLSMIPGARLTDSRDRKKQLVAFFQLFNRSFFLLLALLPFLVTDTFARPAVFVVLIALMNIPGAVANVSWQSFIGGVIPAEKRAQAFATRNQLMAVCGAAATLIAGRVMNMLSFPVGFQIMFAVGFALALLERFALLKIEEPAQPNRKPRLPMGGWQQLRAGLAENPQYWQFGLASLVFHFGWQMAWPLFTKFQIQELGATAVWVSIFSVCSTVGATIAYPLWAKWVNRKGNKFMLIFAALGLAATPLFYAASTELWMLAVWSLIMGFSIAGISLILFNTLLEVSPEENRTSFIAYHNTAANASAVVSPYVGIFFVGLVGIRGSLVVASGFRLLGAACFALLYAVEARQQRRTSKTA